MVPEKAGKTTLITLLAKELRKQYAIVDVLKWTGRAKPDDSEYSDELRMYASSYDAVAIWDRGWPSEYVYGKLLHQDRRMAKDPWLGAWLHDRAVITNGLRIMMLGPSVEHLAKLRNDSDLAVDPRFEVQYYKEYAKRYGWLIFEGYKHTAASLKKNVEIILNHVENIHLTPNPPLPPYWCGPQNAEIVFVGNSNNEKYIPGGWLPFTSRSATMFGRIFGDNVVKYAWTHARNCNPAYLRNRKVIIACGNIAQTWVRNYVADKENLDQKIIYVPHPSYLFRFKNENSNREIRRTLDTIQEVLS